MAFATPYPSRSYSVIWASPVTSRLATTEAESSSLSCGLVIHLPLLSTPSLDDAVTFGYKALTNFDGDLHPADSVRL